MPSYAANNIVLHNLLECNPILNQPGTFRPYDDLGRLLEKDGFVLLKVGGINYYWTAYNNFVNGDPHELADLCVGTQKELFLKVHAKFGGESGYGNLVELFWQPKMLAVSFKYFEEGNFKGYKIYDRFIQEWRDFTIDTSDGRGLTLSKEHPVNCVFRDAVTSINLNGVVKDGVLINVSVKKEGYIGHVEDFNLSSNAGIFDVLRLKPLPDDHPHKEVVIPWADYQQVPMPGSGGMYLHGHNSFIGGLA